MGKPSFQKILNDYNEEVFSGLNLSYHQVKGLGQLSVCRTAKLGGHAEYCENGHLHGIWYNSCRHRSCPQCQGLSRAQWLDKTQEILLDCPHHHVIFTIAHELNNLWRYNRSAMIDMLFKSVHETLKAFSDDPQYLGARPGMISALHTWGRDLGLHCHIHVLISHGGVSDTGHWVIPKKKILFPQAAVMRKFRGCFLGKIRKRLEVGELKLPKGKTIASYRALLARIGQKKWTVHFCNKYVHGKGVAKYLGRYVKGGAFNNNQIKSVNAGEVRFLYKSHQTGSYAWLRLPVERFVSRVVEHQLPPRKLAVRYSGLYSPSCREKLNEAREQLGQEPVEAKEPLRWHEWLTALGHDRTCSHCGGRLQNREEIKAERS